MVENTPFQLSRIYASGWSAGRKSGADDLAEVDSIADSINPYQSLAERERWGQGFKDAVARNLGAPTKPSGRKSRDANA